MARNQYLKPSETPGRWASLMMFDTATTKILYTTYLVSVVNGTLHLVSLMVSIYLTIIFRKIAKLPPDMNPLEDNLTSRHKRNKSEMTDNRTSKTSTAISSKRDSRVEEPLIAPTRSVPFMHTRNESSVDINNVPHPNFSPRVSRTNISAPFHDQAASNRNSRADLQHQSFYSQPPSQQTSQTTFKPINTKRRPPTPKAAPIPSEPTTLLRSPTKSSSIYTDDPASRPTSTRPQSTQPRPLSTAPSLPATSEYVDEENWTSHPSPPPSPPIAIEFRHLRN
ncbi:MAG: hypothetical protein Q9174_007416, partial [Haloplaca sp. 1 TL-2023]